MKKFAVLLAALLIVACSSTKPNPAPAPAPTNNSANKPASAATMASSVAATPTSANSMSTADAAETAKLTDEIQKIQPDSDAASAAKLAAEIMKLHKESVYFDFDKYDLKSEFRSVVEMQATAFKSRKHTMLVLEGNADERGSAAYNMALGERRATSVKKALVILGVPAAKIKVVSYGNTKPKLACHEEKCWKENRRVDFAFKQK